MIGKLDKETMEKIMAEATEYFKDKPVIESTVLVAKEVLPDLHDHITEANIVALLVQDDMTKKHIGMIESVGANPENFIAMRFIVEQKSFKVLMSILKGEAFSTVTSDKAKAFEEFFSDDGDKGTIQ